MKSEAGRILTLIGGVLTLIGSVIVLLIAIILFSLNPLSDKIGEGVPLGLVGGVLFVVFVLLIVAGIFKIKASGMMDNAKTTVKGGIIAIVLGVVTSDVISLVGGIIGVVQGSGK